ncbi:MAG TPA: DNA alkylation repair protein [Verrucomicrobiales bacterium]|nr:DNA alkylation repair protein [Verrucomicrobiales bacterium]HCN78412.1 DNA alkylation repair protein [Verrucomicrobiales bacterium]HRJ10585.1 DNA alkylation repair protein [Prosthecobacter sp.]HRK15451.1 DNA alkylation repair protein [Prosthecobacter sp.]
MTLTQIRTQLGAQACAKRAEAAKRFFKTGPGEYGEGDRFLGLTVPQVRAVLPQTDALPEDDVLVLLRSEWHEERLLALLILVRRFAKARKNEAARARLVSLYLKNTRWVNNWDLVDTSAPLILGEWLRTQERGVLDTLAGSNCLWQQRIAVLATLAFIRSGEFGDTLRLCERFLAHRHDLMHKACGWMLREAGKRDAAVLRGFLDLHAPNMPRTMLRYAVEKLPDAERRRYMSKS